MQAHSLRIFGLGTGESKAGASDAAYMYMAKSAVAFRHSEATIGEADPALQNGDIRRSGLRKPLS
jgi:hypothetical protein